MPQEWSWYVPSEVLTACFDFRSAEARLFPTPRGYDLGMCRLNSRAVFLPTGFARLGWGSVFYLPKPARPTGLRECLLFFLGGDRGQISDIWSFSCISILLIIKTAIHRTTPFCTTFDENIWGLVLPRSYFCLCFFLCCSRKSDAHANSCARERIYFVTVIILFVMSTERLLYRDGIMKNFILRTDLQLPSCILAVCLKHLFATRSMGDTPFLLVATYQSWGSVAKIRQCSLLTLYVWHCRCKDTVLALSGTIFMLYVTVEVQLQRRRYSVLDIFSMHAW